MSSIPTLPGITSQMIATPRLQIHALFSGPADGVTVLFVHGNASASTFWEETMLQLPGGFRLYRAGSVCAGLCGLGQPDRLDGRFR